MNWILRWIRRRRTVWGLVATCALCVLLWLINWWAHRLIDDQRKSFIAAVSDVVSKNNATLSQARSEMNQLGAQVGQLLSEMKSRAREQKDELLAAIPSNGPPVVLAVFPPTDVSGPLLQGLQLSKDHPNNELTSKCRIEYVEEAASIDDTVKELRSKLARENVVLVIGHESSQSAKEINARLYEAKEFVEQGLPVPLILPAATNPELTKSPSGGIRHILRLPATDGQQISRIRQLIGAKGLKSSRVVLIVDSSNPAYANYIARGLILGKDPLKIVDCIGVGLAGDGFDPRRFMNANPDTIVFIGMEVHANLMLRRMSEDVLPKLPRPINLIFTDGVAGDAFQATSRDVAAKAGKNTRIFVTGPFPTVLPLGEAVGSLPNYYQYGVAARELAWHLVDDAEFKGEITRKSVLDALKRKLNNDREIKIGDLLAKFDANGDMVHAQEHVYEQTGLEARHSTFCSCAEERISVRSPAEGPKDGKTR